MYALLDGPSPMPLFFVMALATLISGAIGWGLKILIQPKGVSQSPTDIGRKWCAWTVLGLCITNLTPFIVRLEKNSFALWLLGLIVFGLIAYILGWIYGKLFVFKIKGVAGKAVSNSTDFVNSEVVAGEDESFAQVAKEMLAKEIDDGLWTKAYALENGDENRTKAHYIRLRVAQIENGQLTKSREQSRTENSDRFMAEFSSDLWSAIQKYKALIVIAIIFVANHIIGLINGWW